MLKVAGNEAAFSPSIIRAGQVGLNKPSFLPQDLLVWYVVLLYVNMKEKYCSKIVFCCNIMSSLPLPCTEIPVLHT